MPQPHVVGLTLCDHFEPRPEPSLVGVFQGLRFSRFPSPLKSFLAYAGLYGKSSEGTIELLLSRLAGEADIYSHKRWVTFPDQFITINLFLPVRCVFPAAGSYSMSLRFDGEVLTQRNLEIFRDS
jgi:hypothetical protein